MKFDILKQFGSFLDKNVRGDFDWVTALLVYKHVYNTTHHRSQGNKISIVMNQ